MHKSSTSTHITMKSVLKSLFKKKSKRHVDSDNQCDPGAQYGVSNIGNDLEPYCVQDHPSQLEISQYRAKNNQVRTVSASGSTSTWRSTVCPPQGISTHRRNSRSSVIVHEDRQEPYDPRPIRDIIQIQQRLNNTASTLPSSNATHENDNIQPSLAGDDDDDDDDGDAVGFRQTEFFPSYTLADNATPEI